MKKISILLFVLTAMVAIPSQAQLLQFGVKGGLNLDNMKMSSEALNESNRTGFFIGPTMLVNLPITGFDIDAAALYDYRSAKVIAKGADISETIKQQQVAIPINIRYGVGLGNTARVFAYAGPQFGFVIDKEQSLKQVADWKLKTSNFSVNVGVGAMVLNHLQATLGYNIACGKTGEIKLRGTDQTIGKIKSNAWQIGVAYYF